MKLRSFVLTESDMKPEIWRWICDDLERSPKCKCDTYPDSLPVLMAVEEEVSP
jgi:hypothetical protein